MEYLCDMCGEAFDIEDVAPGEAHVCPRCRLKVAPALLKACSDAFSYLARLRDGTLLRFEYAQIHGEWVRLVPAEGGFRNLPSPCPRGVDVRLADILWVADAPEGS